MTASAPGIHVEGLVKRYGGRAVVDGLDLDVERGSIVALLGPNGAGKTTTVETIEGYRRPDAGRVSVLGLDPARDAPRLRPRLGLMLQDGGVYPGARPRELLRLFARFYRAPRDPDELLAAVGLEGVADTRWRRLSGGERQRLSLALALVGRPDVLVLDEPTAGMDPGAKAGTRDLVTSLRDEGVAILLTTHELPDVERLADRIVVIDRGRIVAEGSPAELLAGARPRLRLRFERPLDAPDVASLESWLRDGEGSGTGRTLAADAMAIATDGAGHAVAGVAPSPAVVARVATWAEAHGRLLLELRTAGATLEERYLELVGPDSDPGGRDGRGHGSGRLPRAGRGAPG